MRTYHNSKPKGSGWGKRKLVNIKVDIKGGVYELITTGNAPIACATVF